MGLIVLDVGDVVQKRFGANCGWGTVTGHRKDGSIDVLWPSEDVPANYLHYERILELVERAGFWKYRPARANKDTNPSTEWAELRASIVKLGDQIRRTDEDAKAAQQSLHTCQQEKENLAVDVVALRARNAKLEDGLDEEIKNALDMRDQYAEKLMEADEELERVRYSRDLLRDYVGQAIIFK